MKSTCPACGAVFSLDLLFNVESARNSVIAALEVPAPIGKLLIQYLALFRPEKRQLSFDRVATLLQELLPMINAARIERNGRSWPAPIDYWKMALEEMITKRDKLTLPLKSHGYLLEIIVGYGNKAEARQEQHAEDRKRGTTQVGSTVPAAAPAKPRASGGVPDSVKRAFRKIKKEEHE